eukprot:349653-Chlamydomonas_euryale.AAC.9
MHWVLSRAKCISVHLLLGWTAALLCPLGSGLLRAVAAQKPARSLPESVRMVSEVLAVHPAVMTQKRA